MNPDFDWWQTRTVACVLHLIFFPLQAQQLQPVYRQKRTVQAIGIYVEWVTLQCHPAVDIAVAEDKGKEEVKRKKRGPFGRMYPPW